MKKQTKIRDEQKNSLKGRAKSSKAITLIALVITIVVLLILSGLTMATLTGENRAIKSSH